MTMTLMMTTIRKVSIRSLFDMVLENGIISNTQCEIEASPFGAAGLQVKTLDVPF